jgi:PST family polysaccharide transporter
MTTLPESLLEDSHPIDDGDLRRQSIRGATALMIGQGFRFVISMASQIYLARILFPADFGLVAMVYPVLGFVALFADFGILQAVVQRAKISQALLSTIFWVNLLISLCLALFFAAISPILAAVYGEPRVAPVALVLSSMIFVSGLGQLQNTLLNRQLKFVSIVIVDIAALLAGFLAGLAGALHGYGYWSLVFSQMATTCTTTVLSTTFVRWLPSLPRRHPELGPMLLFGSQLTGSRMVGYLNLTIDNMMVGVALGRTALGIYDRAWKLAAQPLGQLCAPIDRLAIPVLSRVQNDPARYERAFSRMVQLLCLMAMPGLLFGVVAADRFIPVLLGPRWNAATPVFAWICFGALISPLNNASFWLLITQKRGADQLRLSIVAATINIAAYGAGLAWGAVGVARASAISVYLLQTPILLYYATQSGPVSRSVYLKAILPLLSVVSATSLPLYFAVHLMPEKSVLSLFVGVALAYLLVAVFLGCFKAGRDTLVTVWEVLPIKMRDVVTGMIATRFVISKS